MVAKKIGLIALGVVLCAVCGLIGWQVTGSDVGGAFIGISSLPFVEGLLLLILIPLERAQDRKDRARWRTREENRARVRARQAEC